MLNYTNKEQGERMLAMGYLPADTGAIELPEEEGMLSWPDHKLFHIIANRKWRCQTKSYYDTDKKHVVYQVEVEFPQNFGRHITDWKDTMTEALVECIEFMNKWGSWIRIR